MSAKQGGGPTASQISGTQDFINSHTQQHDPIQAILGGQSALNGMPQVQSSAMGMSNPTPSPAQAPPVPNPIGQGAQQGATAGLTAGLGAGDAAAAAARASAIPGGGSAEALGGMMQNMGDANRANIQRKIDMIKMAMGG